MKLVDALNDGGIKTAVADLAKKMAEHVVVEGSTVKISEEASFEATAPEGLDIEQYNKGIEHAANYHHALKIVGGEASANIMSKNKDIEKVTATAVLGKISSSHVFSRERKYSDTKNPGSKVVYNNEPTVNEFKVNTRDFNSEGKRARVIARKFGELLIKE